MSSDTTPGAEPIVSVILPIYNVERYLNQALNSLVVQTFSDFEAICVNDGSTDGSRAIVQTYLDRDPRFRVVDKPNSGYGASMNRGIREARGRYIAILEPDDFFEPTALAKLVEAAEEHEADVVKANYWFYWSTPQERNERIDVVEPDMVGKVFTAAEKPRIFFSNPSLWSALYRRSFIVDNGLTLQETPGASFQDLGFSFKVWATAQRIYGMADPVLHYRQDNEASSVNNPSKVFCVCDEFDGIQTFINADPARAWLRHYAYREQYDSYLWNFERLTPELRATFLDRMVADLTRGKERGDYDPALFEPRQRVNLELVLSNPQRFLKLYPTNPTRQAKALYYLRIGGLGLVREERAAR